MPFPESKRVIYRKNPLDSVVCQIRFPPILRIDTEVPADFQDELRKRFPNFSQAAELKFEFLGSLPQSIPPEILGQLNQPPVKNYEFASEDGTWKVNLTRSFIALTTTRYTRWEEFKSELEMPFNAFIKIYAPDYFIRVGLRYIDIIKRSVLGLDNIAWNELLQPYVLGMLSTPEVGNNVQDFESRNEIRLSDDLSSVRILTKLLESRENGEFYFVIDSDFFAQSKTSLNSVTERLDFFNTRGSRLIQWCITERLHKAMEPETI